MSDRRPGRLEDELASLGLSLGLDRLGIAPAGRFDSTLDEIKSRKAEGFFGRMRFTTADPDTSCDPLMTLPTASSLVVGAMSYWLPTPERPGPTHARLARYSWTNWYERLRSVLEQIAARLEENGHGAVVLVDDNRLVDREAAFRAGLGHYGKNANLITESAGSWVIIGSVLTDARLEPSSIEKSDCGSCARCIPACPTGAIAAPGVIDARRCIAYLLQSPDDIPLEFREAIGDRIYGCDDCQDCCPPNARVTKKRAVSIPEIDLEPWIDAEELLAMTDQEIVTRFGRFYIPRNDPDFLRRNALVTLGNSSASDAVPVVATWLRTGSPMLRRHAAWALSSLGGGASLSALLAALRREEDRSVISEIKSGLARISQTTGLPKPSPTGQWRDSVAAQR